MNEIYIDVCDNFKLFLRMNNKKLSKSRFMRNLLKFLFFLFSKLNIMQEIVYRRKKIIIIYKEKNKNKKIIEKKINKVLIKENKNKIILSKAILKLLKNSKLSSINEYIKLIENRKEDFEQMIDYIIEFVLSSRDKKIEESNIYVLIKKYNSTYNEKIISMSEKCKSINIVTEDMKAYQKIEEKLVDYITNITVSNNKRKSLSNAKYIINIDYTNEELTKYNVNRNAIIFNISHNKISEIRGFEGNIINNVKVIEKDKSLSKSIDRRFGYIYDNNIEVEDIIGNKGSIKNVLTK